MGAAGSQGRHGREPDEADSCSTHVVDHRFLERAGGPDQQVFDKLWINVR
jgi:hypothetical protein